MVMVTFLAATILAARADLNLRFGQYEGDQMELLLAARGAAAQSLILLNEDDDWKVHDASDPVSFGGDPIVTQGWVTQDADNPDIYHVYGKAYALGNPNSSEVSTRIVLRRPDNEGIVFTNSPVVGKNVPSSLFFKRRYDADWTILPPAKYQYYDENMVHHEDPDALIGSLVNLGANSKGELFTFYTPGYDAQGGLGNVFRRKFHKYIKKSDYAGLYEAMRLYTETLGLDLRKKVFGGGVLLKFDRAAQEWAPLPAIPNVSFPNGVATVNPGEPYEGAIGAMEVTDNEIFVSMHKDGQDGVMRIDLNDQNAGWTTVQPPPMKRYQRDGTFIESSGTMSEVIQTESDASGNLYSAWTVKGRPENALFEKKPGQSWEPIKPPNRGSFDASGTWIPTSELALDIGHMDVTDDGDLFVIWNPGQHGENIPHIVFEYKENASGDREWVPKPPAPNFSFDGQGKASKANGLNRLAKAMSVDQEGRVLISTDGEGQSDDALTYYESNQFEPLAPLPDWKHDKDGQLQKTPDNTLSGLQVEGGGFPNGSTDRFIPVYRY